MNLIVCADAMPSVGFNRHQWLGLRRLRVVDGARAPRSRIFSNVKTFAARLPARLLPHLLITAAAALTACAQMQHGERIEPPSEGIHQACFFETVNLVAADTRKSRIDVPYRIDVGFLVAIRNSDPAFPYPFKRRGEVLIELLDDKGISVARTINHIELGAFSTEHHPDRKSWHEGIASFTVDPGEYVVVFELDDLESERHFLDRNRKVTARRFDTTALVTSTPLFIETKSGEELRPINFGGNLSFGADAALFLQLHSKFLTDAPVRVEYSLKTQTFMLQDPKVIMADTLEELVLLPKANLEVNPHGGAPRYTPGHFTAHSARAIIIPLYANRLPLRPMTISIKLRQGNLEATLDRPFQMIWPEMPASLRDVDLALDALRHITTERELDSLKSGSRDKLLQHLEEFWKAKDRTPETAYNEMMVEYYYRVDYTVRSFSSIKGLDGYKSDRGRVYILYGPPTRSERTLDPSAGYQETWTYEGKNKKFTFVDQSKSGNYILVSTQNL